ncbi:unnamed protein product, partial [Sphacelaria rigidula]
FESFIHLGGAITGISDVTLRSTAALARPGSASSSTAERYTIPHTSLAEKVRFLKVEMIEVMLYGYVTWILLVNDFGALRQAHRGFLLRCIHKPTSTRRTPDYHMLPYREFIERTGCDCIEATVRGRILPYPGRVARTHNERLPNIVMRGEMAGGKRKAGQT